MSEGMNNSVEHRKIPLEKVLARKWVKIPGWHDDVWHLEGLGNATNLFYNSAQISRCKKTKEISYEILGERYGETGEHGEFSCKTILEAKRLLILKIKEAYRNGFSFYD